MNETEKTEPEKEEKPAKVAKAEEAPKAPQKQKTPMADKPKYTPERSNEAVKYFNAPENQARISAFLKRIGFDPSRLTDEHRFNFAWMIEQGM